MRGLSVRQPFASLLAKRLKTIETRTWKTKYRGDVLICASQKSYKPDQYRHFCRTDDFEELFLHKVARLGKPELQLPTGMALAVARLVDCRSMERLDEPMALCQYDHEMYWCGEVFAWVFENVRPVVPIPVKGALNLFTLTAETTSAIQYIPPQHFKNYGY